MSKKTNELVNAISKTKQKSKPKLHTRVIDWISLTALPALFKGIIVVGFGYAVVDNLSRLNQLPDTAQGAVATLVIAASLKVASLKSK